MPPDVGQGRRSDLLNATELISNGGSLREIAINDPVTLVRYHRGLGVLIDLLGVKKRTWAPNVIVYWGAPGTGKTRLVYDTHDREQIYEVSTPRSGSEVWFDGYWGQEVILVDDFYGWLKWSFILKFLDRYPQKLPIKGGFTENLAKFVYFTSNQSPDDWYSYGDHKVESALFRRIDHIQEFQPNQ